MEEKRELNPSQKDFLLEAAGRYIWWQAPEEALVWPQRVLARVMDLGLWEDWIRMAELFPPDALSDVLDAAEIGQFSARSCRGPCRSSMSTRTSLRNRGFWIRNFAIFCRPRTWNFTGLLILPTIFWMSP